jgi:hypothetical protein
MEMFSKKVADVDEYRFEPKPDMTAQELAMILMRTSPANLGGAPYLQKLFFTNRDKPFPPEVARHFHFVQQMTIDV